MLQDFTAKDRLRNQGGATLEVQRLIARWPLGLDRSADPSLGTLGSPGLSDVFVFWHGSHRSWFDSRPHSWEPNWAENLPGRNASGWNNGRLHMFITGALTIVLSDLLNLEMYLKMIIRTIIMFGCDFRGISLLFMPNYFIKYFPQVVCLLSQTMFH